MSTLCEEITRTIGATVRWKGQEKPPVGQFPDLVYSLKKTFKGEKYKRDDFPLLLGSLDEHNPHRSVKTMQLSVTDGYGRTTDLSPRYGFQRFVLEADKTGYMLQKVPVFHGVTGNQRDSADAFVTLMKGGFRSTNIINSVLQHLAPKRFREDTYPNAFLGYPLGRENLQPGAFKDSSKKMAGDCYELLMFETNEPKAEKRPTVESIQKESSSLLFVSQVFPSDMAGIVHLNSRAPKEVTDKKMEVYTRFLPERNLVFMQSGQILQARLGQVPTSYKDMVRYAGFPA